MATAIISKIEQLDHKIFLEVYNSRFSQRSKRYAQAFSFFGNIFFWGVIWLGLGIYGYITKDYYLFVLMTGGFDQSFGIYILIRYVIIKRKRPFVVLEEHGVLRHDDMIDETKSFPSGHVTFFLFFGAIFAFYFNSWFLLIIVLILDVIMGITRLILGVHFPIDILFGFIFGTLFALLYLGVTYIYWVELYYWIGQKLAFLNPQNWF